MGEEFPRCVSKIAALLVDLCVTTEAFKKGREEKQPPEVMKALRQDLDRAVAAYKEELERHIEEIKEIEKLRA